MSLKSPENVTAIEADLPVQWGVYFSDLDNIEAGFETLEDAEDHVHNLLYHGSIYEHEVKIVRIRYEIEEV